MDTFLIIDGSSMSCRASCVPSYLSNSSGKETGGTYRFIAMLDSALKKIKPTHLIVTFDINNTENFRKKIDKNYKSNRNVSFSNQNDDIKKILDAVGIKHISVSNYEADDIIGTYIKKSKANKNIILSGDKDLFQLINTNTSVMYPQKGVSKFKMYDLSTFESEYGVKVEQYVELKALMGDESDNIKGVNGCGIKTASKILNKYGNIKNIINHKEELTKKLKDEISLWYPYFDKAIEIFTIFDDVNVNYSYDDCFLNLSWSNAYNIFYNLEFYSFIKKIKGGNFYNVTK